MKSITTIIGLALILATSAAQAIPTLLFDGTVNYDAGTTELSVSSVLIKTIDITPEPILPGSTMVFSAFFVDAVTIPSSGCFFCADSTKGNFVGSADALVDDLTIVGGDGLTLLTAKFDSLSLEGADGGNRGVIIGLLNATGGSLMSTFAGSDLFAFTLNLDTVFSDIMYNSDFAGRVDGNISSVPEPTTLALLGLGILIAGFVRKNKYSI